MFRTPDIKNKSPDLETPVSEADTHESDQVSGAAAGGGGLKNTEQDPAGAGDHDRNKETADNDSSLDQSLDRGEGEEVEESGATRRDRKASKLEKRIRLKSRVRRTGSSKCLEQQISTSKVQTLMPTERKN